MDSPGLGSTAAGGCGKEIPCPFTSEKKDPMSPYLFLLVADVLQMMIKTDGGVRNPLDATTTCPVLQYADDTLIQLRGGLSDVTRLKLLLDQFSVATGL